MPKLCPASWRTQRRPDRNAVLVATGLLLLLLVQGATGFVQAWTGLSTTATGSVPLARSMTARHMMMNEEDGFASRQQLPGDVQSSSYTSSRRKYLMQLASVAMVPQLVLPAGAMICYPDDEEPATTVSISDVVQTFVNNDNDDAPVVVEHEPEQPPVQLVDNPPPSNDEPAVQLVDNPPPSNVDEPAVQLVDNPAPSNVDEPPVKLVDNPPSNVDEPPVQLVNNPPSSNDNGPPQNQPEGKKEQAEKVKLEQDEKVLIKEIEKEAKDEVKAEKDTDKLIKDLKKQADVTPPKPQAKEVKTTLPAQKNQLAQAQQLIDLETKDLIDQLEQEEEQIEEETLQLMRKVEALEATAERLNKPLLPEPDAPNADEAVQKSQKETNEFLDKLKKRSQDKQNFINLLKQESSAYSAGSTSDKKLPEFLSSLRKTNEDDKEFGVVLNSFREKLQSRFQK